MMMRLMMIFAINDFEVMDDMILMLETIHFLITIYNFYNYQSI